MKAAAPQASTTTQHTAAKGSAKGRSVSAASTGAASFVGALAKAVAAKAGGSAAGAVRPAAASAASAKTGASLPRSTARDAAKTAASSARSRRTDDVAARTVAEAGTGRVVAALPAGALTADARSASAAAARRGEPRIQVTDLRRKSAAATETARSATKPEPATAREAEPGPGAAAAAPKSFTARLAAAETEAKAAATPRATPLERIRAMSGSDLARTVSLVVRDGGGEIRLSLKPESLGGVRIRLSLEDGKVEGRIVVDTPEARQAFEAGLDSLTRALQADGFQTGSLQVTVSGGNANDSRQAAGLLGDTITEARRRASDEAFSAAVPPVGWDGGGDGLVNVFA